MAKREEVNSSPYVSPYEMFSDVTVWRCGYCGGVWRKDEQAVHVDGCIHAKPSVIQ